jgi:hypothetical protein
VNAVDALGTIPLISACRNGSQHDQAFKSIIAVCVRLSTLESDCIVALNALRGGLLQELIDAGSLTDHKNLLGKPSPPPHPSHSLANAHQSLTLACSPFASLYSLAGETPQNLAAGWLEPRDPLWEKLKANTQPMDTN